MCSELNSKGIEIIYTLINSVAYFIKNVDKVFVGSYTMYSNGSLIANAGTSMLALNAYRLKIPFYVVCQTYKFSERNAIDALNINQEFSHLTLKKENSDEMDDLCIRIPYDLTPSLHISAVITELGLIPSSSVAVI